QVAFGDRLAQIRVHDLTDRLGRVADARGAGALAAEPGRVVRVLDQVSREPTLALAAEAAHALRRVGGEADSRLLPVVADVDAGRQLPLDDVSDGRLRLAREIVLVDRLATILSDEQVTERRRPGQAADVSGKDTMLAALHGALPATSRRARCWDRPSGAEASRRQVGRLDYTTRALDQPRRRGIRDRLEPVTSKEQVAAKHHAIVDDIVKSRGVLQGPFTMFLHSPDIAGRVAHLGASVRFEGTLDMRVRVLAAMTVAR